MCYACLEKYEEIESWVKWLIWALIAHTLDTCWTQASLIWNLSYSCAPWYTISVDTLLRSRGRGNDWQVALILMSALAFTIGWFQNRAPQNLFKPSNRVSSISFPSGDSLAWIALFTCLGGHIRQGAGSQGLITNFLQARWESCAINIFLFSYCASMSYAGCMLGHSSAFKVCKYALTN